MTATTGLIADIGATNARFALSNGEDITRETVLKCADYAGLTDAIRAYLAQVQVDVPAAAIAIAGPVTGDYFSMTNHPWHFSVQEVRAALGLDRLSVMNDFKAIALSIPHLTSRHVRPVGPHIAPLPKAPMGVIGPGTGLGVASVIWGGQDYVSVPGEGGHVTMAARSQREFDVFQILREKYRHVSAERVCSGKGLVNLYEALRILEQRPDLPDRTPEDISAAAISRTCPVCVEALDMMLDFLGNIAGNLALTIGAFGGIYLAGGICTQLGEFFFNSRFRESFESKGRFDDYLRKVPTFMILHPFPAFIGLQAELLRSA